MHRGVKPANIVQIYSSVGCVQRVTHRDHLVSFSIHFYCKRYVPSVRYVLCVLEIGFINNSSETMVSVWLS